MVRLELDDKEARILAEILRYHLSELRMEIADTDSMNFREALKEKEALIRRLLENLPSPEESASS